MDQASYCYIHPPPLPPKINELISQWRPSGIRADGGPGEET